MPTYIGSTAGAWNEWNSTTASASSTDATTWNQWCGDSTGSTSIDYHQGNYVLRDTGAPTQTPEEQEAAQREREEQRAQCESERIQRNEEREAASQRAEELLRSCLSPEQIRSLEEFSYFVVESELGRRYRIERGHQNNIKLLSASGDPVATLCAHPRNVPAQDTMLAQALMLQANEQAFLNIANRRDYVV